MKVLILEQILNFQVVLFTLRLNELTYSVFRMQCAAVNTCRVVINDPPFLKRKHRLNKTFHFDKNVSKLTTFERFFAQVVGIAD